MANPEDALQAVKSFRKVLHQFPELSGKETETPGKILEFLRKYPADNIIRNLGGTGLALIYDSGQSGPAVMFRCELDALPIQETSGHSYQSVHPGVAHLCGHDGHMAIMCRLAQMLGKKRPIHGKAILLFQPAEETGEGAAKILQDPAFAKIKPDYAFGLHNLPGFGKGHIIVKNGIFSSASKGLTLKLTGKTAHAAEPENARSPALALAETIQYLSDINEKKQGYRGFSLVTVVHALLGEIAFGITPGYAELRATFRAHFNEDLQRLSDDALEFIRKVAEKYGLTYTVAWSEEFPATENNAVAMNIVKQAVEDNQFITHNLEKPFKWSEDFGHFSSQFPSGFFGLGAGKQSPALHHENYDFPDEIIEKGALMFLRIIEKLEAKF